ncbi:hypothetical protein Sjap_012054 [Stephania japonica]|uniref:Fungal lipase-type domain-containing protein n=1 Tax=Stephania japonica TaxID=461633 RepID=A0AAP0JEP3_9MAGN
MSTMEMNSNNGGGGSEESKVGFRYEIVRPERGRLADVLRWVLLSDNQAADRFLETNNKDSSSSRRSSCDDDDDDKRRWVMMMSVIVRKMISAMAKPMEWSGWAVEYLLNLLSLNGQLLGLLYNLIVSGKVVIPRRDSASFKSAIGHLDARVDLFFPRDALLLNVISRGGDDRPLMDLCILASKLAYENPSFISNIVTHHWKMHFLQFFNGWNELEKERSTQVFLMCDRPVDANFILVSFRGTEPFDAHDWTTDFDYSWYHIPNIGKLHMGFLEALGLGNRADASTFQNHLTINDVDDEMITTTTSAYYAVRSRLKTLLLEEHKNAKFILTGHSLGGALALLFPTILLLHQEKELMQRLLVVYTFGQPRVGDRQLGRFMEAHLNTNTNNTTNKYLRLVYCNDLVPRLPYDNTTFLFKHFGLCLYFNSRYVERKVEEEPNRNYFGFRYLIPEYVNAGWELVRGLSMRYMYGEDYKEAWCSIFLRLMGLAIPGVSAHSPTDYVNSVRLGKHHPPITP